MASEVNGVNKTGLGFFTSEGQLKSTDQVQREGSQPKTESASADATQSSFSTDVISNSLTKVKQDFRSDANRAINTISEDDAVLKQAGDLVKQQIETAKELKAALKDNDTDKVNTKTKELAQLQEQRNQLAKEVKQNNEDHQDDRVIGIRIGNATLATIKTDEVKFSSGSTPELSSPKEVNNFISSLRDDKASIAEQRKELKETRTQVKDTVSSGTVKLDKIERGSIRRFEDAAKTADNLASKIRSGSQEAFAFNVNENVARALLG